MAEVIKTTYQLRRGTLEAWERNNPILAAGEPGFAYDKNLLKIGDGITPWKELKPTNEGASVSDDTDDSNKGCVYSAKTHYDFPNIGEVDIIYKAEEERRLYQWNPTLLKYEVLGEVDITIENINIIHGGNANGTT